RRARTPASASLRAVSLTVAASGGKEDVPLPLRGEWFRMLHLLHLHSVSAICTQLCVTNQTLARRADVRTRPGSVFAASGAGNVRPVHPAFSRARGLALRVRRARARVARRPRRARSPFYNDLPMASVTSRGDIDRFC